MAWCPICKNEYRAGIEVCPDCGATLVEELKEEQEETFLLFQTDDEALKDKAVRYLAYCGIRTTEALQQAEEGGENEDDEAAVPLYNVYCPVSSQKEAQKEISTLLSVEAKNRLSGLRREAIPEEAPADGFTENGDEDSDRDEALDGPTAVFRKSSDASVYVDAKSRFQEYRSSGVLFLAFGAVGLVFVLLNVAGVLKLNLAEFSLLAMAVIFAAFLGIGIASLRRAASLRGAEDTEARQTKELNDFLAEHFPKDVLDAMQPGDLSKELLYLKQTEEMKRQVAAAYPELDEAFVDLVLEDYYNSLEEDS